MRVPNVALIIPVAFVLAMFGVIDLDDTQTNLAAVSSPPPLAAAPAPASPPSHGWAEAGAWIALPAFVALIVLFSIKKANHPRRGTP